MAFQSSRRSRSLCILALAGGLVGLTTDNGGPASAAVVGNATALVSLAGPSVAAEPRTPQARMQDEASQVDVDLGDLAEFGGVSLDAAAGAIDVYLTDTSSPEAVARLGRRSRTARVRLHAVANGILASVAREKQAVPAVTDLRSRGVMVTRFGPILETGAFEVGVRNLSAASEAAVRAALGNDVTVTDTSSEPVGQPGSRQNDYLPWYGGDFLLGATNNSNCTSGFTVKSGNGSDYVTTAGHCYPTGQQVLVGTSGFAGAPVGTHNLVGTTSSNGWMNSAKGYIDATFIAVGAGGAAPYVWANGDIIHTVVGTTFPTPGTIACVDGAYSQERCGTVQNTNYRVCHVYSDGTKACDTVEVYTNDGGALAGQGDSGGPVYIGAGANAVPNPGDPVRAKALFSGYGTTATCSFYPTGRSCGRTIWVTPISTIESTFGVLTKLN